MKLILRKHSVFIKVFLILFALAALFRIVSAGAAPSPVITYHNETLIIEAKDLTVQEMIQEMERECRVFFKGLDQKLGEKISFEYEGKSVEDAVKLMLRNIGENNYAFEYGKNDLIRVSVMPSSAHAPSHSALPSQNKRPEPAGHDRAVRVVSIVNNSQAESLGLKPGDLIIEYDGVRIESSQQLIREVKSKSGLSQVEMTVVRDDSPVRYYLKGGLIGVRINTMPMPKGKMDQYFR